MPSDLDDSNQGVRHMKHTALGPAPAQPAAPGAPAACQTAVDRHIEGQAVLNSAILAHNPEVAGSIPPATRPEAPSDHGGGLLAVVFAHMRLCTNLFCRPLMGHG